MENKFNEATPLRPEGDRVLDAPLVEMDFNQFISQVKEETTWADSDRNSITIYKSAKLTIVLIGLHKDAELKPHKANGDITVQVLEGKIQFVTEAENTILQKGQLLALHANIIHSVIAKEESFFMLTKLSS